MLYKVSCYKESDTSWYLTDEGKGIDRLYFSPQFSSYLSIWAFRQPQSHTFYMADYEFHRVAWVLEYTRTIANGNKKVYEYFQPEEVEECGFFPGIVSFDTLIDEYFPHVPKRLWVAVDVLPRYEAEFEVTIPVEAVPDTLLLPPSS